MKATIHPYNPSHKEALLNLLRLNTPQYFAPEEEADLIHYLEKEIELYYVVIFDDIFVGCGGINFADNRATAIISWDIFHPEYQGKSLGTQLMKYRLGKLNSLESVTQIIVRTSQVAYKFYEKQGFELQEIKKDYWAVGFDLYYMRHKY